MREIQLTCVSCGSTVTVRNTPEEVRDKHCPNCKGAMVERRAPGSAS